MVTTTIAAYEPPTAANFDHQECASLQAEELDVLQAIYPDFISAELKGSNTLKLEIPVEFNEPRQITISNDAGSKKVAEETLKLEASLTSLPPVLLEILLPPDYPLRSPPLLHSVHATHSWMSANKARDKLLSLWQPGETVLCRWVEDLNSGDIINEMVRADCDPSAICLNHPAPQLLLPVLQSYDRLAQSNKFSQMTYSCSVCLTSVKGARCIRLSCSHVFCRSCLEDYWSLFIREGDVSRVGCPDPACVKESREATEEELRRVVSEEEVARWKWLAEKRSMEKDPTIIHCPVQVCQRPIPAPKGAAQDSSGWSRLRSCQSCGYSFCAYCRRTWHGPISECPLAATDSFVQEYMDLPEGSAARLLLEKRYGKSNLQRLAVKVKEDLANKAWMDASTQACPICTVRVQKSTGCNHMTCWKCGGHFCYRCGVKLNGANPYPHFSTPGLPCFNQLFDQIPDDDGWQPMAGFDHL